MRYMITFCHIDGVWDSLSADEQARHGRWLTDFAHSLKEEKGSQMVFLNPATKRVTQKANGTKEVLEGQAAGEAEALGGYYIIEADSMEEALEWADRGRFMAGSNEVRQIIDFTPVG